MRGLRQAAVLEQKLQLSPNKVPGPAPASSLMYAVGLRQKQQPKKKKGGRNKMRQKHSRGGGGGRKKTQPAREGGNM